MANEFGFGLSRIKSTIETIDGTAPVVGQPVYNFDLTQDASQVQLGRFLQPPDTPFPPFVSIANQEEFPWLTQGPDVSRDIEYLVVGWVRGRDFIADDDSVDARMKAAAALFDDLHRALLLDRRMGGTSAQLNVRGSIFNSDIEPSVSDGFGIAVLLVRVAFNWTTP